MICYQDRTFCTAKCAHESCSSKLTDEVQESAVRWWGNDGAPIAMADMSKGCDEYVERKS